MPTKVSIKLANGNTYTIATKGKEKNITSLSYDGKKIDGYFITDE